MNTSACLRPFTFAAFSLFCVLVFLFPSQFAQAQTAPPQEQTRQLTNGSTTLTVHYQLHSVRDPSAYNVQVQGSDGLFAEYTPDVPRTYIGTVEERPDAIAAGLQRANGTFMSFVVFANGTSWSSSGTEATSSGNPNWTPAWPTTGVGPGGAGSVVRAAQLGIDASYRQFVATGSNVDLCVEMAEFSVMKANILYLRDLALTHRIGRFLIRADAGECPYEATNNTNDLLSEMGHQWNWVLPAEPHNFSRTHALALMAKPGINGGVAWTRAIANNNAVSVNNATSSGDFSLIWRHEAGHNWGSSHFEGGGEPEGRTVMSGNSLSRFSSSEIAKILPYRDERAHALTHLGAYPFPVPPRANQDRLTVPQRGSGGIVDVLRNDSSSTGQSLAVAWNPAVTAKGSLVGRLHGSGPDGRDLLAVYPPSEWTSGIDHFNYRIRDDAGFEDVSKVYINPRSMQPPAPTWSSLAVGGADGPVGSGPLGSVVMYTSSGDIQNTSDSFRFQARDAHGDVDLIARVTAQSPSDPWAKAGVMIRADAAADAPHVLICLTPDNGLRFLHRSVSGGTTTTMAGPPETDVPLRWLRLSRAGDEFTARVSPDGAAWTTVGSVTVPMSEDTLAGLAVSANAGTSLGGAAFDMIRLAESTPYQLVADDGFEGGSLAVDSIEPLDMRWLPTNFSATVSPDPAFGDGNVLHADSTSTFGRLVADFAGRQLAYEGDVLRLSFDFRHRVAPDNSAGGFRFGLFDGLGAGYALSYGTGGNQTVQIFRDTSGFGSGTGITSIASGTAPSLTGTAKRHAIFEVRRTGSELVITGSIDGESLTTVETLPTAFAGFDTLAIRTGAISSNLSIDNVRIEAFHPSTPEFVTGAAPPTAGVNLAYGGNLNDLLTVPTTGVVFEKLSGPAWLLIAENGTLSGTPGTDDLGEHSVTVRATSLAGDTSETTIPLSVAYPVSIQTSEPESGLAVATVHIEREGPSDTELVVPLIVSGDAESGTDYEPLPSEVTIPPGTAMSSFDVVPVSYDVKSVIIALAPATTHAIAPPGEVTIPLGSSSEEIVLIDDRFDSPNATVGNDAEDPLDAEWTATNASIWIANESLLPGPTDNKAMHVSPSSTFSLVRAPFDLMDLAAPGDTLTLSFDVRLTSSPPNVAEGFRFGFATASGDGLFVSVGTGTNEDLVLRESTGGGFGSGSSTRELARATGISMSDTTPSQGTLVLQRTADGIAMFANFDGFTLGVVEPAPTSFSFARAAFRMGNMSTPYRLDNIRVAFRPSGPPVFAESPLIAQTTVSEPVFGTLADQVSVPYPNEWTLEKVDGPDWLEIAPDGTLSGLAPNWAGTTSFTVRATDTTLGRSANAILLVHHTQPVSIAAPHPFSHQNGELTGAFEITREGSTDSSLDVYFTLDGTATPGEDYIAPESPVTIPAGEHSVLIPIVVASANDLIEGDKSVLFVLSDHTSYVVEPPDVAEVTILDATISAQIAFDTFDVGANPTPGNDSDDPDDLNWNATSASLSIVNDSIIGTGNALHVEPTNTFAYALGRFPAASLSDPGDRISLEFDFRYTSSPSSNAGGMRFGFTTFNRLDETFVLQQGTGGNASAVFLRNPPGSTSPGSGPNLVQLDTTSSGSNSVSGTSARPFAFSITKTNDGYLLEATVDGVTHTAFSDVGWNSYDAAVIRNGGISNSFRVDNVRVRIEKNLPPYFTSYPQTMPDATVSAPYLAFLAADDPNPGDTLEFSSSDAPAWLLVEPDGSIAGTPGPDDIGTNTFTARVTDQDGLFMETPVVINVLESSPPSAPTGLSATAVSSSAIDLSWTASSGADSYNVKRSTTSGGSYTTIATGVTTTSYSDTGLTASTTYYYVVSAVNADGESADSSEAGATTGTEASPPATPTGLSATAVSSSAIDLSWTAGGGADTYNVKRSTDSGGPYTTIATGVTTTSYSDTGLTASTTYYYAVSAVNADGESANSSEASATTGADSSPPSAPTDLSATAVSSSAIDLSWTAGGGADSYNVKRSTNSGGSYTTVATGVTTTNYGDTGLTASTTYYYVVSAVNADGESADSSEASATTDPEPSIITAGDYTIMARHSGKALEVANDSTDDGANVRQWGSDGGANQEWTVTHLENGEHQIIGVQSEKSLDVASASTADGANVTIWTSADTANQRFLFIATDNDYYRITPGHSGKSVEVDGSSTSDGANVQQWTYSGGLNQQWKLEPVVEAATTMHVADIQADRVNIGGGQSKAEAVVTVVDEQGVPVADALVTVEFSDAITETKSGTTDGNGITTILTDNSASNPARTTACVSNITHSSSTYDSAANIVTCDDT